MADITSPQNSTPLSVKLLLASVLLLLLLWGGLVAMLLMQDEANAIRAFETGRFVKIQVASGEMVGKILQPEKKKEDDVVSREEYIKQRTQELTGKTEAELAEEAKQAAEAEAKASGVDPQALQESDTVLQALDRELQFPLNTTPNPAIVEKVPNGATLPKISEDGAVLPYQYYGKKVEIAAGAKPLSIVITNLGFNRVMTEQVMHLDERVTLAISPYAENRQELVTALRASGFETWMMLPLQHENYPVHDYGPYTLLTEEELEANRNQLFRSISNSQGIVGLIATAGETFSRSKQMLVMYDEIVNRGLALVLYDKQFTTTLKPHMLLHSRPHLHSGNLPATKEELFRQMESFAGTGSAVVTMSAMPAIMEDMNAWIATLPAKQIALVPLSAQVKEK